MTREKVLHTTAELDDLIYRYLFLALGTLMAFIAAMSLLLATAPQAQAQVLLPPETVAARQQGFPPPWPTLTQTVSPDPATVGQPVTFTVTVVNNSSYDGDRVFGIIPEGVELASPPTQTTPNGGCVVNPAELYTGNSSSLYFSCSLSPIPAGGAATATISYIPTVPGTVTNTVQDFLGQQVQTTVEVLSSAEAPVALQLNPGVSTPYVVQPGDTLGKIAQRFGTSPEAIAQASSLENPDLIFPGQSLSIP